MGGFRALNVSEVSDGFGGSNFVGEVVLDSGEYSHVSSGKIAVTVILRDAAGKAVYGTVAYVDGARQGVPVAFEAMAGIIPVYASIEAYVQEW